jgi:hypothetical protein
MSSKVALITGVTGQDGLPRVVVEGRRPALDAMNDIALVEKVSPPLAPGLIVSKARRLDSR